VALALKPLDKRLNLFWPFLGASFLDVLWPIFILLGVEQARIDPGHIGQTPFEFLSYPFSHSLLATVIWSGLAYLIFRMLPVPTIIDRKRAALAMAIAVFSHWVLDFLVHEPDLSLWGGDTKVGLSLWQYPIAEFVLETLILATGVFIYLRSTRGTGFGARFGMLIYSAVLLLSFVMTTFGAGAPPNMTMTAIVGLLMALTLALIAGWLDRKRMVE
jgi:hypothetical protein